jgi:hypothetical protein
MKDVQATEEAFSPQKRKSNMKPHFFLFLWVIFAPSIRIRIQPTKTDADLRGSGSTTLTVIRELYCRIQVIMQLALNCIEDVRYFNLTLRK